jgi:hypothetical protein
LLSSAPYSESYCILFHSIWQWSRESENRRVKGLLPGATNSYLSAGMDAPDDNRDIKLYQASADLLPEISRRLDKLLTADGRYLVPVSERQKLISLVSKFFVRPMVLC